MSGDLLGEIAAELIRLGDTETAALLPQGPAKDPARPARVVVVGEKKRGKSSLINALLGRKDLLPVDADIATGVHIALGWAPEPAAVAHTPDGPVAIGFADIAAYGALDPVTAEMAHPEVTHLEIALPDPLLEAGLVLVDTPGVGGLVGGHAALTLAALPQADALVFVVNGTSELTASECEFLCRATERVSTVLFAMTQTDKYPRWREVLGRSQDLVREHAPRFADAPWFPVSSRLRVDAVRLGDAERDADSGFPALAEALRTRVAGAAQALDERNVRFVARRALARHIADQERRLRSLAHDPDLLATISADRDRMAQILKTDAEWRSRLAEGFKLLDRDLGRTYQRAVTEFQAAADRRLAEVTPDEVIEVVRDLDAGVRAIWEELETAARTGGDAIALGIAADFAADGIDALEVQIPFPAGLAERPGFERTHAVHATGAMSVVERYLPGMGMAGVLGHTALGLVGLAAAPIAPFVLIAGGGVLSNALYKQRRRREDEVRVRGDLHRHLQGVLRQMNAEVPPVLQDGLEKMLCRVEQGVSARLSAHRKALEQTLAEHRENLEAAEAGLAPRREVVKAQIARLRSLAEQLARPGALEPKDPEKPST